MFGTIEVECPACKKVTTGVITKINNDEISMEVQCTVCSTTLTLQFTKRQWKATTKQMMEFDPQPKHC